MDSLGYTFFIPDIGVYSLALPLLLFGLLFAINWKFNCLPIFPREKKGREGYPWNTLLGSAIQSGQFSVRESVASTLND